MTSIERVRRAINIDHPDRVPMVFFNRDRNQGDIVMIDVQNHFSGPDKKTSEWGFRWEQLDRSMGQPKDALIHDWLKDFPGFHSPSIDAENRMKWIEVQKSMALSGQYLLGSLQLSGFTVMSFLRGFSDMMIDFYENRDYLEKLADIVFGFENELIDISGKAGLNGVAFFDDWGTQQGMIISPVQWREFFLPRYREQFRHVHNLGMDVYFHSCGKIDPIITDLFDIGVDMLNLSQPNLYDMDELKKQYGGKRCFVIPVSYQTTSISGSREDIFADVQKAFDCFGQSGGLVGYIEEYSSIGMSEENYQSCVDAFHIIGNYSN